MQLSIEWTEDSLGSKAWLNLTTFYGKNSRGRVGLELIMFACIERLMGFLIVWKTFCGST